MNFTNLLQFKTLNVAKIKLNYVVIDTTVTYY